MFTQTLSELHMAEHTARTERVNRDGWMWQKSAPTERRHTRRQFGEALVRLGERLRSAGRSRYRSRHGVTRAGVRPGAQGKPPSARPAGRGSPFAVASLSVP